MTQKCPSNTPKHRAFIVVECAHVIALPPPHLNAKSPPNVTMSSSSSEQSPATLAGISDKNWMPKFYTLVTQAFKKLCGRSFVRDKWLTGESALKLLTERYSFKDIGGLTPRQFKTSLDKSLPQIDSSDARINDSGIFLAYFESRTASSFRRQASPLLWTFITSLNLGLQWVHVQQIEQQQSGCSSILLLETMELHV
jgi:hypothetical protein